MNTPIYDFVSDYKNKYTARFHMPGHKGKDILGVENLDITEIEGADVLYGAKGIIDQSENNASCLFGTAHTYYSTEGSSLCIKAMLGLLRSFYGKKVKILAARNAHKAFIYACALLDIDPVWMYPKESDNLCSCVLSACQIEEYLKDQKADAVYITSPDYLGNISDIKNIARVCKQYGALLLVDNAHGAYLKYLNEDIHPITLGAHMCCDSAHKTLPVLTGGAYLHISKAAQPYFYENARNMLSVFASTSPSYLTLQSLDLCNRYIADVIKTELNICVEKTRILKQKLTDSEFYICPSEELKIVINANKYGYSGTSLSALFSKYGVESEFADNTYCVFMVSPKNTADDFDRLLYAAKSIKKLPAITEKNFPVIKGQRSLSIKDAVFGVKETIATHNAVGKICGAVNVSCPPAIPIAVSGEIISEEMITVFNEYNIKEIEIIKTEL